jgi:hypothetical protein
MRATLIAFAVLIAACGQQAVTPSAASSPEPASASPSGVVAVLTGVPLVANDGTVEWCPGMASDGCAGIEVTGLSQEAIDAFGDPQQAWQIEGNYDGQTLAATGPPQPVQLMREPDFVTPCEDLRGGRSAGNMDGTAADAVAQYVATIRDRYAGEWWDSEHGVLTVLLTGDDVADHRAALDEAVGDRGTVCVVGGARYSYAELEQAQQRAMDIAHDAGMGMWGSGIDTVGNRVDLDVEQSDEPARERIRQALGDAVRIHAFLALRDATLAELPKTPARGDVELRTADTRGGGGMDALTYFTLRFDTERRCFYGEDQLGERMGLIWPFGYYATSDPLQVFDQDGALIAREGDRLESGGGGAGRPGEVPKVCGAASVWIMNGAPQVVPQSAPSGVPERKR